jgi:RNA polymerase sigma factor (TIGR02999 family)
MSHEVTLVLNALRRGDPTAADQLLPLVYQELRRLAARRMAQERAGHTLQPTALVHEAWLRVVDEEGNASFENRGHFFGAAAEAMRRILIDRARSRAAAKRGGGQERIDIEGLEICAPMPDEELLSVHEVLDDLAAIEPEKARLVKLRYFAGLSIAEVAEVLEISEPTAKRWWAAARAWLYHEITVRRSAAG